MSYQTSCCSIFDGEAMLRLLSYFLVFTLMVAFGPYLKAQTAKELKEKEEAIRQSMLQISRQLGVTCNTCHNTNNFKSSEKPLFQIASFHMKITQQLIDSGFNGKEGQPKADCYMCHRGQLKPDFKEKILTDKKK